VTKRKQNPKQGGRKSWSKQPLFTSSSKQKADTDDADDAANKRLHDFVKHFDDTGIEPSPAATDEATMALNHDALDRALALALNDPERRDQINAKLMTEHRNIVARFASYGLQIASLCLRPWQTPPSYLQCDYEKFDQIIAQADPRGDYACVLLTVAMMRHGVSVYEPSPLDALEKKLKHAPRGRPPR
jgi:hypothetical protein